MIGRKNDRELGSATGGHASDAGGTVGRTVDFSDPTDVDLWHSVAAGVAASGAEADCINQHTAYPDGE